MKNALFLLIFIMFSFTSYTQVTQADLDTLNRKIDSLVEITSTKSSIFTVSVGARLSLVNASTTSDLYYDINGFIPSVVEDTVNKPKLSKFGLLISISQNRIDEDSVGLLQGERFIQDDYRVVGFNSNSSEYMVANTQYYRKAKSKFNEQISLDISPTFKIFKNANNFYLLVHAEALYGMRRLEFSDELISIDTTEMSESSFNDLPTINYPFNTSEITVHSVNTYWGGGMYYLFEKGGIEFNVKASAGVNFRSTFSKNGDIPYDEYATTKTRGFYHVKFNIKESNSRIKLGADIRGLLNFKHSSYSIVLSREFSLKKLGDFIK